jgi:hypothetical protein
MDARKEAVEEEVCHHQALCKGLSLGSKVLPNLLPTSPALL